MPGVEDVFSSLWESFTLAIPGIISALIWIVVGIVLAVIIGRIIRDVVEKYIEAPLSSASIGRMLVFAGFKMSSVVEWLVKALIIALAISIAFTYIPLPSAEGAFIRSSIMYLPRLVIGLLILIIGLFFSVILVKSIAFAMKETFSEQYKGLSTLVENIIFVGLLAMILSISLETMGIPAKDLYPLILGALIMVLGVIVSSEATRMIRTINPGFEKYSQVAQFIILILFIIVGVTAMFAQYQIVGEVVKIVSIGISIGVGAATAFILYKAVKD